MQSQKQEEVKDRQAGRKTEADLSKIGRQTLGLTTSRGQQQARAGTEGKDGKPGFLTCEDHAQTWADGQKTQASSDWA